MLMKEGHGNSWDWAFPVQLTAQKSRYKLCLLESLCVNKTDGLKDEARSTWRQDFCQDKHFSLPGSPCTHLVIFSTYETRKRALLHFSPHQTGWTFLKHNYKVLVFFVFIFWHCKFFQNSRLKKVYMTLLWKMKVDQHSIRLKPTIFF